MSARSAGACGRGAGRVWRGVDGCGRYCAYEWLLDQGYIYDTVYQHCKVDDSARRIYYGEL